jgi:hypothetical protein
MKPAVMIGTEDRILNRWAHFAKKYSFLPLIGDGSTKYVNDVWIKHEKKKKNLSELFVPLFLIGSCLQNPTCICCWCCCCNYCSLERWWKQYGESIWAWWARNLYRAWIGNLSPILLVFILRCSKCWSLLCNAGRPYAWRDSWMASICESSFSHCQGKYVSFCMLVVIFTPKKKVLLLLLWTTHKALGHLKLSIWFTCTEEMILLDFELFDLKLTCTEDTKMLVLEQTDF